MTKTAGTGTVSDMPAPPSPPRLWDLLAADQRAALTARSTRHTHPLGTVLLREGEASRAVLVLASGTVKVVATGIGGHRALLAIRVAGDVLGELSVLDGRPHSATVVAMGPVELLRITSDDFGALLRDRPGVAYALLQVLSGRLRLANLRRVQQIETTAAQRVATALAELAADHGTLGEDGVAIVVPLSQDDLAMMVGASREAVVRALRTLRDERVIRTGRQRITILQPEALGWRVRVRP